jgi:deoxyribodipyrimidine photolyase-related protein
MRRRKHPERLLVILGDQLDDKAELLDSLDPERDLIWMAEVERESTHVWSHKARTALFLSAMRHFRERLAKRGMPVRYLKLGEHRDTTLGYALRRDLYHLQPRRVLLTQPGDYRVLSELRSACLQADVSLEVLADRHFRCSLAEFDAWAEGRKTLRLEHFYRYMRRRHGVLMDGQLPAGGKWNYDAKNRGSFGQQGPGMVPSQRGFEPDETTRQVIDLVQSRFPHHPGNLVEFDWPVTPEQATEALEDFMEHRLRDFGLWQDAMWIGHPVLYHARISAALNLKLLDPGEVIRRVEEAWRADAVPLEAAEGFIRQVLGWREFVRGLYWRYMPKYLKLNALDAHEPLPDFYWTGDTDMACLQSVIDQTLRYGYAHHIQRLMVTGLFAQLLGVEPQQVHEWYLAVYVDAVEWVEAPNTLGMSQFADGGLLASKPYAASGAYIQRMSNYCSRCRYKPKQATGPAACPFTTLYWDFLLRHRQRFERHPRAGMQWRHLWRLDDGERQAIAKAAAELRAKLRERRESA